MKRFVFSCFCFFFLTFLYSQNPCDSLSAYFDSDCINVSGGSEPYSFLWIDNNNGFSFICNSQYGCISDCENYNFCPGDYSVVVQDNNQCTTSVSFFIDEINIDFSLTTLHIDAITGGVADYNINWYQNNFLLDTLSYQGYNLCSGDYFIEIIDNESCKDTFFFSIDSISANFNIDNLAVESIQGGTAPYSFVWFEDNNNLKIDNNFATSLCEGNYHVTIYDINQCFLDIYFDIDPLMTNLESSIECSNNSFDGEIEVSASGGISPYIYIWNNFDLGEVYGNTINNLYPGVYYLEISDNFGCIIQDSIVISPLNLECVSNVFSPNDDGVNDLWSIEGSFLFQESRILIYNRYGRKVFESNGNKTIDWNGTNLKGQKLSEGIYYYVVTLKNNITPYKGFISLFH